MSSIFDLLEEVSIGQFKRPNIEKYSAHDDPQNLLSVASRAALNQSVAYFESEWESLTLVRDYDSWSIGGYALHLRTVHVRIDEEETESKMDPISYRALRRHDGLREFFVLVEHCVYSITKWKFFPNEVYAEDASWETHGDRLTRLRKNKIINRNDEKCLRRISDARNLLFHSMLFKRNIEMFGIPLDKIGSDEYFDVFEEKIRGTLAKIWDEFYSIQHNQVDWEVFSKVFELAKTPN